MISILIPTYNDDCTTLVAALVRQAAAIDQLDWEIVVCDDASTDAVVSAHHQEIGAIDGCRLLHHETNRGRAVSRNHLAQAAQGDWLLFIDGDATIIDDRFLAKYLAAAQSESVCYGGYRMMPGPQGNLRWIYEKAAADKHTVVCRRQHPYDSFNISNLLIRRDIMLANPLDERFRHYGYEDVLLGKLLEAQRIPIGHIDAPVGYFRYEDNAHYIAKTEEGLRTLYTFRKELQGFSKLLDFCQTIPAPLLAIARFAFRRARNTMRRQLESAHPRLILFSLYKLGYFLSLSKDEADRKD